MKVEFKIKQIAQIASKLRQYKKLFVTTNGQMFIKEQDAEEAIRVKNMILEDQNDYAGLIELTEEDVTTEKLKRYAKNVEEFNELFKDAKIPVTKKKAPHERKREEVIKDDADILADVTAALTTPDEEAEAKAKEEAEAKAKEEAEAKAKEEAEAKVAPKPFTTKK